MIQGITPRTTTFELVATAVIAPTYLIEHEGKPMLPNGRISDGRQRDRSHGAESR
jgi:hypothetical protein